MGKGKGITFTIFAALGALTGYASYMVSKNQFSEETKDNYDSFINKAKNVGTDIQRTYTSIGDKSEFTNNTKNLQESALKLASKTGDLVVSATSDMFSHAREQFSDAIDTAVENFNDQSSLKKTTKKKIPVKVTNKSKSKNIKKTNKKAKK